MVKKAFLLIIGILIISTTANAQVYTMPKTDGYSDAYYVVGNSDNYPLEYYNAETKAFEGVMPDILYMISEKIGSDFVYINGQSDDIDTLAQIPHSEIDGLIMKYSKKSPSYNLWIICAILAIAILLIVLLILLLIQNKKIKTKNEFDMLTDNVTGIGNLSYFKHRLENGLDDFERSISYVAYIILDSSYRRSYHGSFLFSDVIKVSAEIISSFAKDNEFAARITENSFAIVYQSPDDFDAKKRLEEIMKKLNESVDAKENNKLVFHAALCSLLRNDKNSEILLFNLRKNCMKIFGTEEQIIVCDIHAMNRVLEEKKIVESIINGFKNNEFTMYLQFVVDAKTKKITLAEALSRWDSKEKGLLPPAKYIPIMESDGLISKHDLNMFEIVCGQLEEWEKCGIKDISISCNFTRISLSEDGFIDKVKEIYNKYSFDHSRICVEITEDAIEKNMENALLNIKECKKLGFRIALDDLGSGYTSLSNLCDYPIDVVKIDRDILLKTDDDKGKSLFEGIVELSHKLKLNVICEGVETNEQNLIATEAGCDYIQGYYYYKPLPVEECKKILMENK